MFNLCETVTLKTKFDLKTELLDFYNENYTNIIYQGETFLPFPEENNKTFYNFTAHAINSDSNNSGIRVDFELYYSKATGQLKYVKESTKYKAIPVAYIKLLKGLEPQDPLNPFKNSDFNFPICPNK